jgi:hypothetical protein
MLAKNRDLPRLGHSNARKRLGVKTKPVFYMNSKKDKYKFGFYILLVFVILVLLVQIYNALR